MAHMNLVNFFFECVSTTVLQIPVLISYYVKRTMARDIRDGRNFSTRYFQCPIDVSWGFNDEQRVIYRSFSQMRL